MRTSSAGKARLHLATGGLVLLVAFGGSGCAAARLGRPAFGKAAESLPNLELAAEFSGPQLPSAADSPTAALPTEMAASHIPDSVKLTELLQRVAESPGVARWQLELARQYLAMDQPLLAEQAALRAVGLDQQCGEAWVLRGELAERREDWIAALRCYQQALSAEGDRAEWQARTAHCYEQLGEHRRALSALERAVELYPAGRVPTDLKVRRGRLLAELRQYRRAIAELQEVTASPTQDATPWLVLSEVQVLSGDTSGARLTLSKALELFPNDALLAQRQQRQPDPRDEPVAIAR